MFLNGRGGTSKRGGDGQAPSLDAKTSETPALQPCHLSLLREPKGRRTFSSHGERKGPGAGRATLGGERERKGWGGGWVESKETMFSLSRTAPMTSPNRHELQSRRTRPPFSSGGRHGTGRCHDAGFALLGKKTAKIGRMDTTNDARNNSLSLSFEPISTFWSGTSRLSARRSAPPSFLRTPAPALARTPSSLPPLALALDRPRPRLL